MVPERNKATPRSRPASYATATRSLAVMVLFAAVVLVLALLGVDLLTRLLIAATIALLVALVAATVQRHLSRYRSAAR